MDEKGPSNVCRACLTETGDFQSVFVPDEATGLPFHLSEMIMSFSSVQVTFGDGLPEQICTECARSTVKLYLFKRRCEESDRKLRERFGKLPSEKDQEEKRTAERGIDAENVPAESIVVKPEFISEDSLNNDCAGFSPEDDPSDALGSDSVGYVKVLSDEVYKCKQCSKLFNRQSALNRHMKSHAAIRKYECHICNKRFTRNDLLLRHKIAHAMRMNNEKIEFGNISDEDTIIIKTEDDLFPCAERNCDLIFIKRDELDTHVRQHFRLKDSVACEVCAKKFTKQAHLTRHMKIHSDTKPYCCDICKKGFIRSEQLANHMNVHSGVKPHTCEICLKGFNQISNLKDHMRTHNGERPFLCSTCGKGFNQLGNLRQHTIRHSGVKAHLCSTCGNGFASKGELSAHLRKHTGARPFVCPVCNHGFTTSSSLTKHKRIHSGEKPYECDVCKMKFSRSGILARHKRTHTGEKPYVCKFCTKAFSQSNDLTSHLRIHTGEKPYICDVCGQAFRQSSALKTHKKTHIDRNSMDDSKPMMGIMQAAAFLSMQ